MISKATTGCHDAREYSGIHFMAKSFLPGKFSFERQREEVLKSPHTETEFITSVGIFPSCTDKAT